MLRHLYDFELQPPATLLDSGKVAFYCNIVIVAEAYTLPGLMQEAEEGLTILLDKMGPVFMLQSLRVITETYSNSDLLNDCADDLARKHLEKLASTEDFRTGSRLVSIFSRTSLKMRFDVQDPKTPSLQEGTGVRCAENRSSRKRRPSRSVARTRPGTLGWRITDKRLSRATPSYLQATDGQLLIIYSAL